MKDNKRMSEEELAVMVQNEKEWRKLLFRKIESLEARQTNLEIKVATIAAIFGVIGGFVQKVI